MELSCFLIPDICLLIFIQNKIDVVPIPGVSSLLAALVGSGMDFEKFYYYGWLSPKKDIRRKQLLDLKKRKETIVLMDTPYRLKTLMTDIVKILGANLPSLLAFELTKENEKFCSWQCRQHFEAR